MVLVAMKSVVIACKTITEDIEGAENGIPYNDTERGMLANGKGQLSAALSGLMAVAKAHAAGTSWGPEALVTSANQLTAAVNDLARAAGSTARAEPEHVEAQALPPAPALSVTAPEPPVQQVRYTPPVQQQQPPPAAPSPTYEPPTVPRPPSSSYSAPAPAPAPVIAPPPVVETQAAAPMSPPSAAVQSDASPSQRQTEVVELDELKVSWDIGHWVLDDENLLGQAERIHQSYFRGHSSIWKSKRIRSSKLSNNSSMPCDSPRAMAKISRKQSAESQTLLTNSLTRPSPPLLNPLPPTSETKAKKSFGRCVPGTCTLPLNQPTSPFPFKPLTLFVPSRPLTAMKSCRSSVTPSSTHPRRRPRA